MYSCMSFVPDMKSLRELGQGKGSASLPHNSFLLNLPYNPLSSLMQQDRAIDVEVVKVYLAEHFSTTLLCNIFEVMGTFWKRIVFHLLHFACS